MQRRSPCSLLALGTWRFPGRICWEGGGRTSGRAGDSEWKVEWSSKRRTTIFKGEGADDGWDWVEQMLDLSEEEFVAQVREELEDEEELVDVEEGEGEDEGEEIA